MNKYDELPSLQEQEYASYGDEDRKIYWSFIALSCVSCLGTYVFCWGIFSHPKYTLLEYSPITIAIYAVVALTGGAICLAQYAWHNWIVHGIIYALLPPIALLAIVFEQAPSTYVPDLLTEFSLWQIASIAMTLITMAFFRKWAFMQS